MKSEIAIHAQHFNLGKKYELGRYAIHFRRSTHVLPLENTYPYVGTYNR